MKKFVKYCQLSEDNLNILRNKLYLKLVPNSKLYLLTNPLVSGKNECEIESLFPKEVLNHKLDNRTLCLKDKYDIKKYYGKEIFSNYISSNYNAIDFSNFRQLLDALNLVIKESSIV